VEIEMEIDKGKKGRERKTELTEELVHENPLYLINTHTQKECFLEYI
jgi:hypothetical protein